MQGVKEINIYGYSIFFVDYEGCQSADDMIQIFNTALESLLQKQEPQLVLINFESTHIDDVFLNHIKVEGSRVQHVVGKSAFIGMNKPKKIMFDTFALQWKNELRAFDSVGEAIKYLIDDGAHRVTEGG